VQELSLEEVEAVAGGSVVTVIKGIGGMVAGHVFGKLVDAFDRAVSSPGTNFEMTPGLEAVAAGNMTA
jgi:hypothetical protein